MTFRSSSAKRHIGIAGAFALAAACLAGAAGYNLHVNISDNKESAILKFINETIESRSATASRIRDEGVEQRAVSYSRGSTKSGAVDKILNDPYLAAYAAAAGGFASLFLSIAFADGAIRREVEKRRHARDPEPVFGVFS